MNEPLLSAENLTKDYGSFRALASLNLSVSAGEVVGLLGPNGSGKSTALRMMLGFLRPTAGRVRIGGGVVAGDADLPPAAAGCGGVGGGGLGGGV